jgi:hypothetical protein
MVVGQDKPVTFIVSKDLIISASKYITAAF